MRRSVYGRLLFTLSRNIDLMRSIVFRSDGATDEDYYSSKQGVPLNRTFTALMVAAPAVLAVFTAGCGGTSHSESLIGKIVEYTIPTANSGPAGIVRAQTTTSGSWSPTTTPTRSPKLQLAAPLRNSRWRRPVRSQNLSFQGPTTTCGSSMNQIILTE